MTDPVWQEHLTAAVTAVNSDPEACPSNASKIQKFAILPRNFSVQSGELTPTFKLKRQFVEEQYASVVAGLYGATG
jgi:long-subunit acyl-CoA synthetase (AMP-forming)